MYAATFDADFVVRHYECDLFAHLNHTNYFRLLQEAALRAAAHHGHGRDLLRDRDRGWVLTETYARFYRPLGIGDSVRVTTWADSARRFSALRQYLMGSRDDPGSVARAVSRWSFVDLKTGRPAPIPVQDMDRFTSGALEPPPQALELPPWPPELGSLGPRTAFSVDRRVEHRDIDPEGHVNNAGYVNYMEDCALMQCAYYGWPLSRMADAGFAAVARRYGIRYRAPAFADDYVRTTTWIAEVRQRQVLRHFQTRRIADGTLLAEAYSWWAWIDTGTGKPIPIPGQFRRDFVDALPSA